MKYSELLKQILALGVTTDTEVYVAVGDVNGRAYAVEAITVANESDVSELRGTKLGDIIIDYREGY